MDVLKAMRSFVSVVDQDGFAAAGRTLGVHDVVAKSIGTSNPHNMIKATFDGLRHCFSPRMVAQRRGKKVSEVLGRRDVVAAEARE